MTASKNNFHFWQRPSFNLFSRSQLDHIYAAALEVLARVGGEFHDPATVALLSDAGARVDTDRRVRIPESMAADALQKAPRQIVVHDRNGQPSLFLEDRNTYFGPGSDTPYTLDPVNGVRRPAVLDDVVRAARVVDALPELDFSMCFALASDVPDQVSDLHHFAAMVRNTHKPLIVTAWELTGLRNIHRMMEMVAGDKTTLRKRPFVVVFLMAISPLRFPKESLQKLRFCAESGIPCIWTSGCPTAGATAPIFPAGSLVVALAEFIAGLVVAQLTRPGTSVILGSAFGALDMATGSRPYAAPEQDFGHLAQAEVARYLQLPSWGNGGCSDSNTLDQQATLEAGRKLTLSALAGNNIIHDLGYLDSGMTSSLELLVICNEIVSQTRRFLQGIPVTPETLAMDTIAAIGPGDHYLTHRQTKAHYREQIWRPELITRKRYDAWVAEGEQTLRQRARIKLLKILETHQPQPLAADVLQEMDVLLETAGAACKAS
ncbi:MAG: trimethylamine methyltransferase family protein [Desulfobacterales bacterium]